MPSTLYAAVLFSLFASPSFADLCSSQLVLKRSSEKDHSLGSSEADEPRELVERSQQLLKTLLDYLEMDEKNRNHPKLNGGNVRALFEKVLCAIWTGLQKDGLQWEGSGGKKDRGVDFLGC